MDRPTSEVGSAPKWLASMLNQLDSSMIEVESTNTLVSSSGQSTIVSLELPLASTIVVDAAEASPVPPELAGSVSDCTVPDTESAIRIVSASTAPDSQRISELDISKPTLPVTSIGYSQASGLFSTFIPIPLVPPSTVAPIEDTAMSSV